ncbi:unnamed protein product, partial [Oppiella nova]
VECGKILTVDNFIERLGSPYCKEDYHRLFSPKCCVCTEPIKDKAINALGKMWHTYCFKCTACACPLEEKNFYEKNGMPYCEKDYMNLFHPKCTGCGLPIAEGRQITAMGKPWHPECFVCTICVKPLQPETFKEHAGKPYCEDDYHKLFSPKCGGCQQPITDKDEKVMVRGKPWHPGCNAAINEPVITVTPAVEPLLQKATRPKVETDIGRKSYPIDDLDSLLPLLDDFVKKSYPDCSGCKTPITDVSLTVVELIQCTSV